jgi:hypothetical protein
VSKKRARKSFKALAPSRSEMLTKAAGAPHKVRNEFQAVTCMLLDLANDPDPGTREAAKAALRARAG